MNRPRDPDHRPRGDADLRGVPGRLEHQREELPARQGLRGRQVPDLAVGLVALAQRHESAGHVLQVVERVGLVERAEPARAACRAAPAS